MALTKCKECDSEISNKARLCPNCGVPIKGKISIFRRIALTLVTALFLLFVINKIALYILNHNPESLRKSQEMRNMLNEMSRTADEASKNLSPEELKAVHDSVRNSRD